MELKLTREDFINQYPLSNNLNKKDLLTLWNKEGFNLYIHIPYCTKRCKFCYYKSLEHGEDSVPDEYIQALLKEIEMVSAIPQIQAKVASSIYFGGGTPTKLTSYQIQTLMDKILSSFNIAADCELCFEARPAAETDEEKLCLLMDYGIKRLSFGAQSLDDQVLEDNGRNHNSESFYRVFDLARKIGIPSINVDIMSGMVNQTFESWMNTIDQLLDLRPENIAIYKLELYLNSELYKQFREQKFTLMSDDEEAELVTAGFQKLMDFGYIAVTNFSVSINKEYNHTHRKKLWEGEDMLGIGASSHSCYNNYLFQNEIDVQKYINSIKQGKMPMFRAYSMSKKEIIARRIIFGLKLVNLEMKRLNDEFGFDIMALFRKEFEYLQENGFIEITKTHINLTLKGIVYGDDIVRLFYLPHQKGVYMPHAARNKVRGKCL
ncbi:MAG: coproporphyrinogen III oxidase family protein [Lachnospiraceae bacterium]|nr:coproporphyrinogen III oxidase family protein [Lachnospiraceae bacterium]